MDPDMEDMDMVQDTEEGNDDFSEREDMDGMHVIPPMNSPGGSSAGANGNGGGDGGYAYNMGGYSVNIMEKQMPFLGQLLVAPILILASTLAEFSSKNYGYATAVAVVAILFSAGGLYLLQKGELYNQQFMALPILGPCSVGYTLSLANFVWWGVAAGILTFSGPFTVTGNGYFAVWAGFFASALGVGITQHHLQDLNQTIRLATASIVIICAVPSTMGGFFDSEAIFALTLACFTLVFCIITTNFSSLISQQNAFYMLLGLTLLWVIEAALVTFRGPFTETGNGYFASWGGAFLCIVSASSKASNAGLSSPNMSSSI
ncbi:unnamed protein product [Cylindrotheca closterium]|uniref:Uncharacterized protein n=1 Tax=Cylindrotheca closterium TaxID=2856 RepID=A0AAD2JLZ6_9STRA|nr:unnamed protein product [Cylindrotheca closterium]